MSKKLSAEEIESLKGAFQAFDADGNGTISRDEVKNMMASINIEVTDEELGEVFTAVDADGSGTINFEEFVNALS